MPVSFAFDWCLILALACKVYRMRSLDGRSAMPPPKMGSCHEEGDKVAVRLLVVDGG
jgi:hypothetical protein